QCGRSSDLRDPDLPTHSPDPGSLPAGRERGDAGAGCRIRARVPRRELRSRAARVDRREPGLLGRVGLVRAFGPVRGARRRATPSALGRAALYCGFRVKPWAPDPGLRARAESMKLVVLRHDVAEPREPGAGPDTDAKRALTG